MVRGRGGRATPEISIRPPGRERFQPSLFGTKWYPAQSALLVRTPHPSQVNQSMVEPNGEMPIRVFSIIASSTVLSSIGFWRRPKIALEGEIIAELVAGSGSASIASV